MSHKGSILQRVESSQSIPTAAGRMAGLAPLKLTSMDMETADTSLLLPVLLAYYPFCPLCLSWNSAAKASLLSESGSQSFSHKSDSQPLRRINRQDGRLTGSGALEKLLPIIPDIASGAWHKCFTPSLAGVE
jgi:hypothetical protein